jgi:hypothetical protein
MQQSRQLSARRCRRTRSAGCSPLIPRVRRRCSSGSRGADMCWQSPRRSYRAVFVRAPRGGCGPDELAGPLELGQECSGRQRGGAIAPVRVGCARPVSAQTDPAHGLRMGHDGGIWHRMWSGPLLMDHQTGVHRFLSVNKAIRTIRAALSKASGASIRSPAAGFDVGGARIRHSAAGEQKVELAKTWRRIERMHAQRFGETKT